MRRHVVRGLVMVTAFAAATIISVGALRSPQRAAKTPHVEVRVAAFERAAKQPAPPTAFTIAALPAGSKLVESASMDRDDPVVGTVTGVREKWHLPDGATIDVSVGRASGGERTLSDLLADRAAQAGTTSADVNGNAAVVEHTADKFGPGLWIVTWVRSDGTAMQVAAGDSVTLDEVVSIAASVEVTA